MSDNRLLCQLPAVILLAFFATPGPGPKTPANSALLAPLLAPTKPEGSTRMNPLVLVATNVGWLQLMWVRLQLMWARAPRCLQLMWSQNGGCLRAEANLIAGRYS